ncbi:MAG TPA: type I-U CRISPR-associated helicase/endonuclease Cas3, partial [Clostridia bacterium]|nr:type I-U CRISPR-associated helicase/endonuclease Cas3 [Clostridia bacterium]
MTFENFFGHIWKDAQGQPLKPFPWQSALARWVREQGKWPEAIDVPTSAGKTALIDIAVFALASSWAASATRIFFVVDRRVVVDEARERAETISRRIETDQGLEEIRRKLTELSGSDRCLHVSAMHGGMPLETSWAKSPVQPTICLSTVDQLGSRLLFRGYGVSKKMAPIHAGLAATDALIILDEAHLSEPFRQTLCLLKRYRSVDWCSEMVGKGLQITYMSATLPNTSEANEKCFRFQETYADGETASEVLTRRLEASKLATLETVGDKSSNLWKRPAQTAAGEMRRWRQREQERQTALNDRCVELAYNSLLLEYKPKVIGVILNRVSAARSVFEALRTRLGEEHIEADAVLLTGRSRAIDRKRLITEYWDRLKAGRQRSPNGRPIFVIATQCIEAGANLDFDALVTEIASLDALRQRFGRLNRLGELKTSRGWIVARYDQIQSDDDPIYGPALKETFRFLDKLKARANRKKKQTSKIETIDFGINAFAPKLLSADLSLCVSPHQQAPTLLPAHLDYFAQTNPQPSPAPDPAIFLHGPKTGPGDVNLVWRADLPGNVENWCETLSVFPPTSGETLPLPIYAFNNWLQWQKGAPVADVEGIPESESPQFGEVNLRTVGMIWRGKKDSLLITRVEDLTKIRSGDTIILHTSAGGLDDFGWNPDSTSAVRD